MNLNDFGEMEELFKGMGIKDWSVDVPSPEGNLRDTPLFGLPPEIAGKYLRYGFGNGLHGGGEGFACGLHLAAVMADGAVAKCTFYRSHAVGNVDEGLEKCWERIVPLRLGELACDCTRKKECRGGCRYRAGLLGDSLGRDLYRCVAYDIPLQRG
jgi:radical SAM protein with 4Fe4S-binding SPASM domain